MMEDRIDTCTSLSIDNMEESSVVMHSSSISSYEPRRNGTFDGHDCSGIGQAVQHLKRCWVAVLDTNVGVVDDLAAAQGHDILMDRPVECMDDDLSDTVSLSGNVGDIDPSRCSLSTRQRHHKDRPPFNIAGATWSTALTAVLYFALICATSAAAATDQAVAADGVGVPALGGRFQRRHVTATARTNLRRSPSSTSTFTKVSPSEENSEGRRTADFFTTDRKTEPLEFRIENVNQLRPTQSQGSQIAAVANLNYLPPLSSPTSEKRATIVFHQPVIDPGIRTKEMASYVPYTGTTAASSAYMYSSPQQTQTAPPMQKQIQPHGGSHWHAAAANFGPQTQFNSVGSMIPAAKGTFHSPSTTTSSYFDEREKQFAIYQDTEEDHQIFYKQTQEEKEETAKAREGLLAKLYGQSLEKPNHSDDVGETSAIYQRPATTLAAHTGAVGVSLNPPPLQGRDSHYSFTLVGNTISVVISGAANPIPTDFTVDPFNGNCVVESGCAVFYNTSTNEFVDANGAAVGVGINIETIKSQNAGSISSRNNNLTYTLFLEGNTIIVRHQGRNYPTRYTVDSKNCVQQSNNCEIFWDGIGGFVGADGQAASVEINLKEIITSSGAGTSTTGGGSTTTTTTTTTTNSTAAEGGTTTGNNDKGGSDSADVDSAEHSGKGYRSSSGKGKGKGSTSKTSKASKGCKGGKSGKSGKGSKSSKSCSSSSSGKGKGGSHPPPPSPPSSPSKPSPSRPTRRPVSRPTTPSRPTRAPRPSQTPKPTRRPRTRPTPEPTGVDLPTVSPMPTRTKEPTPAPVIRTPRPTFGPTDERCNGITDETRAVLIRYNVIPISGLEALTDTESPQWQAYEWLVYNDNRFVCPNDDTLVQRYILAVLYFATAGDAWDRCYQGDSECREEEDAEPYLSASSECEWFGSECFPDGLIERVTLENNNLMNEMPLEITQIARLLDLNLSNNDLEGTLPRILGDLADLRTFNVEKNSIEGRLPESMFALERLEVLNLNGNDLSGTINEKVGDLRRLKEAHFGDNGFEGEIPSSLGKLSDLELLRLQDNDLEGEMPAQVCELRDAKLDVLWSDCGTPPDPPQVECELDVCCTECFSGRR